MADTLTNLQDRIVRDPKVCGGEPVFKGTRVTLRTVLASLAAGDSVAEILADFPTLKAKDIQAAIEQFPEDREDYLKGIAALERNQDRVSLDQLERELGLHR